MRIPNSTYRQSCGVSDSADSEVVLPAPSKARELKKKQGTLTAKATITMSPELQQLWTPRHGKKIMVQNAFEDDHIQVWLH